MNDKRKGKFKIYNHDREKSELMRDIPNLYGNASPKRRPVAIRRDPNEYNGFKGFKLQVDELK